MSVTLVCPEVIARWDREFRRGSDKRFPSLELVRLEKWYFKGQPGWVLEYGCGSGLNFLYLLECGYLVDGLDASREAIKLVEQKLAQRPELRERAALTHLDLDAVRLPYADETFEYVVCLSVLSLLGSRQRVERLLQEFLRVMKPRAKMILDINGPTSEFASKGTPLGNDVYAYRGSQDEQPFLCYCPETETRFRELLEPFEVQDVGFAAHRYMGSEIFEYLACASKPSA